MNNLGWYAEDEKNRIINHAGLMLTWPGMGEVTAEDSLHLENDSLGLRP